MLASTQTNFSSPRNKLKKREFLIRGCEEYQKGVAMKWLKMEATMHGMVYSTVWLCRDLQGHQHVAMKVYERDFTQAQRELHVYNQLNPIVTEHIGSTLVRTAVDNLDISLPKGNHLCLVHKPLAMSLAELRARAPSRKFPEDLLKPTLIHIFYALDFLHNEAQVIHTGSDLNTIPQKTRLFFSDIMSSRVLGLEKIDGDRIIYQFRKSMAALSTTCHEDIQPYLYRAPKVLLRMRWDNKVDIWNVGVLIWDLFENMHLFDARDENRQNLNLHHLAEMVALLGTPPVGFLRQFFDYQGAWKGAIDIPAISLEMLERNLSDSNKDMLIQFVRKMLQWNPEARQSAKELLDDPWLRSE
ncbi:CMGC/SRPK protein kinase [Blastomyces gilchristii SLH14081]|uniref:non-specific serine/threonine protein kinase n=1 Tax=Blastomyces gilchristii (strain SLH14081) TaxID=559298 RepID=A0A179UGL2_BLAGS|nr:CMGC/SRPK protein kinase [Blastomyces gilchristii SLH14081]OAT06883.1 CMGC/SRPK protein kinase [Blastomyces gilchristii SLH14081]